jgi:acyl-CoA synthetase (AMP-forming)/AMP-acid ligase II
MDGKAHIGQALWAVKAARGNQPVTVCDGRVQTGAQFVDRIAALSIGLRRHLGLQSGDRVAIAALNRWVSEKHGIEFPAGFDVLS